MAAIDGITFPGDIYLFGIWSGVSAKLTLDYLDLRQVPYDNVYGFDSFVGLPEEERPLRHREHGKGKYSSVKLYGEFVEKTIETAEGGADKVIEIIEESVDKTMDIIKEGVNNPKLKLIPGFYADVLDTELVYTENMGVASFVDIDVDLHGSTVEVLTFLFSHGLVAKGTTIYFDDWGATKEYKGGESLAWKDTTEKYNIKYEEIHSSGEMPYVVKVFQIK